MQPWPSAMGGVEVAWEPVRCSTCGAVIGFVAGFDTAELETPRCATCESWHRIACTRCRAPLGHTARRASAIVFCASCRKADQEARARRESGRRPVKLAARGPEEEERW